MLIVELTPAEMRGRMTALSATLTFVGQFLSPLLMGPVIDNTSLTAGFLVASGIAGVSLMALLVTRMPSPAAEKQGAHSAPQAAAR